METIDLGLVKAIESGTTPPANIQMLWYDDNTGIKKHKFYNTVTSTWDLLGGFSVGPNEIPYGDALGNVTSNSNFKFSNGGILIKGLNQASGDFVFKGIDSLNNPLFIVQNNGDIAVGFGTAATAKFHIKGVDSTPSNYSLKIDNSASSQLFYVRNDGDILINGNGRIVGIADKTQFEINLYSSQSVNVPPIKINDFNGSELLRINADAPVNLFIGYQSGVNNNFLGGAVDNTFVGYATGQFNTTGYLNSFFGKRAGQNNTTGGANSSFGAGAGQQNQSGVGNSFFGYHTGVNTLSSNNSFFGAEAGAANTTGQGLTLLGRSAGNQNQTGNGLTFVGNEAGLSNKTGNNNLFGGTQSGYLNDDGSQNVYAGPYAGWSNVHGYGGVYLGYGAGYYETGDQKLFIDNAQRANEADGRQKALIYGVFGNPATQVLAFNAQRISLLYLPTSNSGLIVGDLYIDTAANILSNGDKIVGIKI